MEIKFERKGKLPDLKGKSRQHCVMAGRRASGWVVVEWKEFPNSLGRRRGDIYMGEVYAEMKFERESVPPRPVGCSISCGVKS